MSVAGSDAEVDKVGDDPCPEPCTPWSTVEEEVTAAVIAAGDNKDERVPVDDITDDCDAETVVADIDAGESTLLPSLVDDAVFFDSK